MAQLTQQWTVESVHALPDDGNRYEVIDGELFVTPAPSRRHQGAVGELYALLRDYFRREQIGRAYVSPVDVIFSEARLVQPDVIAVPIIEGRLPRQPDESGVLLLAVEVLSPSSVRADRGKKRTLYREEHVPEYWIVDLDARTFERCTLAGAESEIVAKELSWHPHGAAVPLVIDLVEYFATVVDQASR